MMKQGCMLMVCVSFLICTSTVYGQTAVSEEMYIDYMKFFGALRMETLSGKGTVPKAVKALQDSAALLVDEAPPTGYDIKTLPAGRKILVDEAIYAKRKHSVFIMGKLMKANDSTGRIDFDLTGTAFAIASDGICVTNYHVLQDLICKDTTKENRDSIYFITTLDKEVYFIEKILAYSQNNDIAVVRVNTNGARLQPIPLGMPAQVGATVYCISHPLGYFYYFSKGMVARNVRVDGQQAAAGYNPLGRPPIRMEITADYAVGSSGGPILDKYGNLVGIVSSTASIPANQHDAAGNTVFHQQMVVKDTAPLKALTRLLKK